MNMVGSLLLRGMLVGIVAGLLAFGFAKIYGEPQVDRAIAFEEQTAQAAGEAPEPELVSRPTQAGFGLLTGVLVYAASIGGLFSLVFAYTYGRISSLGPRATSAVLALAAFVSIVLVPDLKYPANPPSVGNPDTIGSRTVLFFIMLVISIAALTAAVGLSRRLWAQYGPWNATIIAGAAFIAVITVAMYVLPTINEVPEKFSADLLWRFRVASLGIHMVLWTTIGLVFGAIAERSFADQGSRSASSRPALR
ncbi:membrane protein [Mesorhizobium sp. 113-3-9]|nr:membrane protein [Mesorhizobium sp. 113-3-9]